MQPCPVPLKPHCNRIKRKHFRMCLATAQNMYLPRALTVMCFLSFHRVHGTTAWSYQHESQMKTHPTIGPASSFSMQKLSWERWERDLRGSLWLQSGATTEEQPRNMQCMVRCSWYREEMISEPKLGPPGGNDLHTKYPTENKICSPHAKVLCLFFLVCLHSQ